MRDPGFTRGRGTAETAAIPLQYGFHGIFLSFSSGPESARLIPASALQHPVASVASSQVEVGAGGGRLSLVRGNAMGNGAVVGIGRFFARGRCSIATTAHVAPKFFFLDLFQRQF